MKKVKFTATIYKQEAPEYTEDAVVVPEESEQREIKTRKVSDKEMAKLMKLKAKLEKMGSPWERKYKREALEKSREDN